MRILAIFGALVGALALFLVWVLIIWPIYIQPAVTDHDVAVVQSVLRKGMTRGEVDTMIDNQIPKPLASFDAEDKVGSYKVLQYLYKDELCDKYYKEVSIRWSHDRVAGWTVDIWGPNSCFN